MKRPAFQFYPADWRKDAALQSCSMAAQGLWMNLLCVMHECDPYGHLSVNARPMKTEQVARLVGLSPKECGALLVELAEAGVSAYEDGFIFSRRMVRDERLRNIRADAGRLGGNPNLLGKKVNQKDNQTANQPPNQDDKQSPTPSSSSSSSSSNNTPQPPAGELSGFREFWEAWPKSHRKGGLVKCREVWAAKRLEAHAEQIVAHVAAMAATKDWTKEDRQYVPAPIVYLRSAAWSGSEVELTPTYAGVI